MPCKRVYCPLQVFPTVHSYMPALDVLNAEPVLKDDLLGASVVIMCSRKLKKPTAVLLQRISERCGGGRARATVLYARVKALAAFFESRSAIELQEDEELAGQFTDAAFAAATNQPLIRGEGGGHEFDADAMLRRIDELVSQDAALSKVKQFVSLLMSPGSFPQSAGSTTSSAPAISSCLSESPLMVMVSPSLKAH